MVKLRAFFRADMRLCVTPSTQNITLGHIMDHGFLDIQVLYPPSPKMCCFIRVRLEKTVFQNWFSYFPPKIEGTREHNIKYIQLYE